MMETFEVYPNKGIGPFRLGMTEDKVESFRTVCFPESFRAITAGRTIWTAGWPGLACLRTRIGRYSGMDWN